MEDRLCTCRQRTVSTKYTQTGQSFATFRFELGFAVFCRNSQFLEVNPDCCWCCIRQQFVSVWCTISTGLQVWISSAPFTHNFNPLTHNVHPSPRPRTATKAKSAAKSAANGSAHKASAAQKRRRKSSSTTPDDDEEGEDDEGESGEDGEEYTQGSKKSSGSRRASVGTSNSKAKRRKDS